MPVGRRKEADAYSKGCSNFCTRYREASWKTVGDVMKSSQMQHQRDAQEEKFQQANSDVGEYLTFLPLAKDNRKDAI